MSANEPGRSSGAADLKFDDKYGNTDISRHGLADNNNRSPPADDLPPAHKTACLQCRHQKVLFSAVPTRLGQEVVLA